MQNILSQMPKSLLETVSITRESAFEGEDDIEVAIGVECYINPSEDLITVERGFTVRYLMFKLHLGEPIADIAELDDITRAEGKEPRTLKVYRAVNFGTERTSLIVRSRGVA